MTPPDAAPRPRRLPGAAPWIALTAGFVLAWTVVCLRMPTAVISVKDEVWHVAVLDRLLRHQPTWEDVAHGENDYPPAYYFLAYAAGRASGSWSRAALAFPNLLLVAITLIATRGIARAVFGDSGLRAGILAAAYLFPCSYAMNTAASVICSTTVFTLVALRLLDRKESPIDFVHLGLAIALALLTKQSAPVFFAAPLAWLILARRRQRRLTAAFLGSLAVAVAFGALAAYLLFYRGMGFAGVVENIAKRSVKMFGDVSPGEGLAAHAAYYPAFLLRVFAPLALVLAIDVARGTRRRSRDGGALAVVLVPTLALSCFRMKSDSYLLPILPVWTALLTCRGPSASMDRIAKALGAVAIAFAIFVAATRSCATVGTDDEVHRAYFDLNAALAREAGAACAGGTAAAFVPKTGDAATAYNDYVAWSKRPWCRLDRVQSRHAPPETVIVYREPAPTSGGACYTEAERAAVRRNRFVMVSPSPREAAYNDRLTSQEEEWMERLLRDYVAVRTVSASNDSVGSIAFSVCARRR